MQRDGADTVAGPEVEGMRLNEKTVIAFKKKN